MGSSFEFYLFLLPTSGSAEVSSTKSIEKFSEIKNAEKITERASIGETDLDVEGIGVNKYTKEVTTSKGNIIEYDVTEI
ncbi:hypothetical protein GT022_10035 [Agaribacter marinus]|uniref:Uncharacterized protein n=1 Tax=Virgibacillus salarius TaxID=447199 RepID=A0A941DY95_9BACI|nr:hypothetical protein [Virgibacillus salarius]MBR7796378.1 hypothetical protein [Virgibacillus salarius]NAZ09087.1 hypothetical protein [Agaribacter marinus]WBX80572.1 hypothetical protein PD280_01520 [Virgibacillus salarius]